MDLHTDITRNQGILKPINLPGKPLRRVWFTFVFRGWICMDDCRRSAVGSFHPHPSWLETVTVTWVTVRLTSDPLGFRFTEITGTSFPCQMSVKHVSFVPRGAPHRKSDTAFVFFPTFRWRLSWPGKRLALRSVLNKTSKTSVFPRVFN